MANGVAITGMGIISSIGNTVEENLQSLLSESDGISTIENIATRHANNIKVGEIKLSNEELAKLLALDNFEKYSRTTLLGAIAAKQAIESANINDVNQYKTGFISSTSVGGMDLTEKYCNTFFDAPRNEQFINSHNASESTQQIASFIGLTDFVTTISTACSSAANAIMLGARLIKAKKLDRVIVGGTDGLSKFTLNGFKTLMILSDKKSQPFDKNRKGLNLGEGAAYLVLESEEVVAKENKKVLAFLSGYANANDAHHQTASSEEGEGAFLAMKKALKLADLETSVIDYINAHGTGTPNNDASESEALKRIFEEVPIFSSTKAYTGHTLAAAGGIEAVFSILALKEQKAFANLNFADEIEKTQLKPTTKTVEKEIKHVLSNSFGFGGNCSTLIFSKV
ncbi:beta-ketoacyl-[acyl-carrier-protein] synthase family protein [Tenacibaculum caenipelagi]|uniref:3-oxoacyl-[acyl-carrier-protein] synthase-1 n=1 Tax=Tenacibaculum caenipelagi TaxID=1325435 RepID=A0A4R6TI62_9FLAO|nr:beta-ketoacyl-[acyl-carrier-protein] synthase family protein [Tenacibaculum caenipelagi]TDQ28859.1 3-oxoacyl-[acyl-carrier-protein] synthase-1 [Tenacibaculum caenipelagi]